MYHGNMNEEVPVSEARSQLSELVNRVRYGGDHIVLTRHGRGVAALVPLDALASPATDGQTDTGTQAQVIDLGSRTSPPPRQIAAQLDLP